MFCGRVEEVSGVGFLEKVEMRWRDYYLDDTVVLEYQPAKSLV